MTADGNDIKYESNPVSTRKSTAELFGEFYEMLKGDAMDEKRKAVVEEITEMLENME